MELGRGSQTVHVSKVLVCLFFWCSDGCDENKAGLKYKACEVPSPPLSFRIKAGVRDRQAESGWWLADGWRIEPGVFSGVSRAGGFPRVSVFQAEGSGWAQKETPTES